MITIVLPCYNGAKTVGQAVASVWNQGRSDLEIVAIDDGSSDETLEVLQSLAAESPVPMRIRANKRNQLTAKSINEVYPSAGELLTILHQDDMYPPGRFDDQVRLMTAEPALQILYANGVNFKDEVEEALGPLHQEATNELLRSSPREIERFLRENQNPIFLQPALMRRDLLEKIGGFDEECMSDDWATNIRIFSALNDRTEFGYLDENVYLRRKHTENFHRNQRIMSLLRMEVLNKYARTPRRNEVLADHYRQQAEYLTEHGFFHHAVPMLVLAALRYVRAAEITQRDRCVDELRRVLGNVASMGTSHDDLSAAIELLLAEGPSASGYLRLLTVLEERGLHRDSDRVRERLGSSTYLQNLPRQPPDLLSLLEDHFALEVDKSESKRGRSRLTRAIQRWIGSDTVLAFHDVQTADGALWEHYSIIERLRYDLERRGHIG